MNKENNKIYTCPMHPEIKQDKPGMCPECGMALMPTRIGADERRIHADKHDKHQGHSTELFLRKFWVVLILTIPLVAYSELTGLFLGFELTRFPGIDYLILALGSVVFFYGGWVFVSGAYRELKARLPGMMTLIALAISAAYLWSIYATFTKDMTLFWELSTLIAIMLLGHWIEMKSVKRARGALKELAKLLPDKAEVIRGGKIEVISISELKVGDVVLIKPGAKVPADGRVSEGQSDLDESIVTGESKPVSKKVGDEVIAGTINGDGSLKVEITKTGQDTFLSGVMRLVAEAEASKSRLQILSDKAALILTIIAVSAGAITLGAWLLAGGTIAFAVARLVAVLVIACPHALGLAVPLVASISTNMAASHGFIIKRRLALEAARNVNVVLFDKTGTLTKGEHTVTAVKAVTEFPISNFQFPNNVQNSNDRILLLAASVEIHSEHPIAKAVVSEAKSKNLELFESQNFRRIPGIGAEADVSGKKVFVGHRGGDEIVVEVEDGQVGMLSVADVARPESKPAVDALHKQGLRVVMITGDSEEVAREIANELGVDEYFARVLPEQKVLKVKELQNRGLKVAMVGDGVNDAPALTQADVGIAVGAGTNVAIESAGIILARNDPRDISKITKLSRLTYTKMIQNLFWATGYNILALPLAAGALMFYGVPPVEPALAAVFMSASTVIVAFNALILRKKTLV